MLYLHPSTMLEELVILAHNTLAALTDMLGCVPTRNHQLCQEVIIRLLVPVSALIRCLHQTTFYWKLHLMSN